MDYDGQNAHSVTNLGTVSLSPRISPDNTKLAFASMGKQGWSIRVFSLELDRYINFPTGTMGSAISPRLGQGIASISPSRHPAAVTPIYGLLTLKVPRLTGSQIPRDLMWRLLGTHAQMLSWHG